MSQDIATVVPPSCDLLALGEPTHWEPAFGTVRNLLFDQVVRLGFRSIALETDRVAALKVDDFVRDGVGDLDEVIVVEEKRDFIETMMRDMLYRHPRAPRIVGKVHEDGSTLFSRFGELDVDAVTALARAGAPSDPR